MTTGPEDEGRPGEPTFADVMNGFSFDSGRSSRRRWGRRRRSEPESEQAGGRREWTPADYNQAYPDPYSPAPSAAETSYPGGGYPDDRSFDEADETDPELDTEASASVVRPYAWTRGRTKSGLNLEIETLVSTSARGREQLGVLQYEHRSVAELCEQTRSVAEVAALLSVPLGV